VVSGSAFLPGCLACRAGSALDDDPRTVWQTPFDQVQGQWAQIDMAQPVTFDHLDLGVIADGKHSVPTELRLDVDGTTRVLTVPNIVDDPKETAPTEVPRISFPAVTGKRIRVTIAGIRESRTRLFGTGRTRVQPAGIAAFGIAPVTTRPANTGLVASGCRRDLVMLDGKPVAVRVNGKVEDAQSPMGLTVTPCDGTLRLDRGPHVLTTARGADVGFSIDRLAFASGTAAMPATAAAGHVRITPSAPASATVDVVHNGDTKVRVHVTDASKPFWLVLGESNSPGWHAHVVNGHDLGPSQLVDGYANGWLMKARPGSFDVVFEWTPQRQVRAAILLSLFTVLLCFGIIAFTWIRRRSVVATADTPLPGDADVDVAWDGGVTAARDTRLRVLAPLVTGLLGALVVAPWVGVLIAVIVFGLVVRPRIRPWLLAVPAGLLGLCGVYIVVQQARYKYPPVFEWPTVFPHARTLAWIAVLLLTADAVVEILQARARSRNAGLGSEPDQS
jgi:arabinofuranan 3-O-arabinosyltransferase